MNLKSGLPGVTAQRLHGRIGTWKAGEPDGGGRWPSSEALKELKGALGREPRDNTGVEGREA